MQHVQISSGHDSRMAQWTHIEGAHDTLLCGCVKSTGGLQPEQASSHGCEYESNKGKQALQQMMLDLTSSQMSSRGFLQQQQHHLLTYWQTVSGHFQMPQNLRQSLPTSGSASP